MTEKMIREAYCKIRTIDQTIPDDVLDFMRDASIEKLKQVNFISSNEAQDQSSLLGDVSGSSQEEYDELCTAITKLQKQYDENGYNCSPIIKLQRIEQHFQMSIDTRSKDCR